MTDTPVPDVRERVLARKAVFDALVRSDWYVQTEIQHAIADAVLAAVSPVIRQQERAATADEIAGALDAAHDAARAYHYRAALMRAAAIARSHSQYTGTEETNRG